MNEFTKEELYKICAIVTSHFCDIGIATVDKQLINKIESMIDNYPERECSDIRDINCIEACPTCGEHHDN